MFNPSKINQKEPASQIKINEKKSFWMTKRTVDILGAISGLILLFPIFLVVASVIKLENFHANCLFIQERVGQNGKLFKMYKFRSMIPNAEEKLLELKAKNEMDGAMFKIREDPRITKVGKFIRKTSLDELPQLLNVLKGNMSLVGPRPPLEDEVKAYSQYDWQRLMVPPGCSGLWQISGRNDLSFQEMVELDLKYIETQSIKNDLIIIGKTVHVLFHSKGAY